MQDTHQTARRRFLKLGLGAAAAAALPAWRPLLAAAPADPGAPNAITPDAALTRLLAGNARYAQNRMAARDYASGRGARSMAQYPIASILACSDSRVAPELLFDQGPGELFVVRIAGNYLNPDALASLEYGVAVLHTPLVMVLGHSNCGAVKATIAEIQHPEPLPGHIADITHAVRPAIERVVRAGGDGLLERAIDANVAYNAARVAAAQPLIAAAVRERRVRAVGAEYDIATGKVRVLPT